MYVYIRSEPRLFTVGFYDPSGKWHPDSDHVESEDAAKRVRYLNGGTVPPTLTETWTQELMAELERRGYNVVPDEF